MGRAPRLQDMRPKHQTPSARSFSRLGAARQIRIAVALKGASRRPGVAVYQALATKQKSTETSQCCHDYVRGAGNPSTCLLGSILDVGLVRCQEISTGSRPKKYSVFAGGKRLLLLELFLQQFQPRRSNIVGSHKVQGLNKLLNLTRIRLIFRAGVGPSDDPIQDAAFLVVLRSRADATSRT